MSPESSRGLLFSIAPMGARSTFTPIAAVSTKQWPPCYWGPFALEATIASRPTNAGYGPKSEAIQMHAFGAWV